MKINWKRGLFRFWLVLSLIWIITNLTFLSIELWPKYQQYKNAEDFWKDYSTYEILVYAGYNDQEIFEVRSPARLKELKIGKAEYEAQPLEEKQRKERRAKTKRQQGGNFPDNTFPGEIWPEIQSKLIKGGLFAGLPPLITLILGWAALWAMAGFRASEAIKKS